jgi:hypothetical protein
MEQLNLFELSFPLYSITRSYKRIWREMNVLYIETDSGIYILDNKNLAGDTVGKRRLQIKTDYYKVYVPRKVVYNVMQLLHSKEKVFMDTDGIIFKYKKTEYFSLRYHKVDSVIESKDGNCILEIPKIDFSYKTSCRNAYGILYVGILHTKYGHIPYDFSEVKKKDTRRKI